MRAKMTKITFKFVEKKIWDVVGLGNDKQESETKPTSVGLLASIEAKVWPNLHSQNGPKRADYFKE